MGVDATRPYGGMDYSERKDLEEHASTSAILNQMAKDTGVLKKGQGLHLHGEDKSYEELNAEQKGETTKSPEAWAEAARTAAFSAVEGVALHVELHGIFHLAEQAADVDGAIGPIVMFRTLVKEVHEDWVKGQELNAALIRDGMHLGLVESMRGMPECYVEHAKEERSHAANGDHGPHAKIVGELLKPENRTLRLALQLRTDEGMKTAVDLVRCGGKPAEYLKAQGLEARYRDDAAFHAGFDAMIYASQHSPEQFAKAKASLEARDERYNLTQVFKG